MSLSRREFLAGTGVLATSALAGCRPAPRAPALLPGERTVERVLAGMPTVDGAGVQLTRVIGQPLLRHLDPFVLLDRFASDDPAAYIRGFPDHPHRGFETVSVMLDGHIRHRDSRGNQGLVRGGGAQWMTAGRGIVHSEMPSDRVQREGGRVHGFQLWVNLPARDKMIPPRYQEIPKERLPRAESDDGKASVTVIAGEALGARAVIETRTPIAYHDWTLAPGAGVDVALPDDFTGFAYVFEGEAIVGGRYLATISGEYTHWINPTWGAAVFVDAGNAVDNRQAIDLAVGYGVGARWRSPAGPLGIDLAYGQREGKLRLVDFLDERASSKGTAYAQPPYTPSVMKPFYDDFNSYITLARYGVGEAAQARYFTHSVLGPDGKNDDGVAGRWNRTLDYLFVRKTDGWSNTDVLQEAGRMGITQDALRLSDHAPVVGTWELR